MLDLNLIHKQKSNIDYTILTFPDGEIQVRLGEFSRKEYIYVTCRICNPNDLFILMQVNDILTRHGVIWNLKITYLMGARMDRVMDFSRPFTLSIIANIINSFSYKNVYIVEAHSDITKLLIRNSSIIYHDWNFKSDYTIVLPDKGSVSRYGYDETKVICSKVRDEYSGNLLGFSVTNKDVLLKADKSLLIVDDLCDGGGTFCGIASKIREFRSDLPISIAIVHAVNRKGIDNLSKTFKHVWFTNSYKDWEDLPDNVTQEIIA